MDKKNCYCQCGSKNCICQDGCCCSPPKCVCAICRTFKFQAVCPRCGHGSENLSPITDKWHGSGRHHRDLRAISDRLSHFCKKDAAEGSDSPIESETDDIPGLIFQMDDIDSPPKTPPPPRPPLSSKIRPFTGTFQSFSNVTLSNARQSQTSEQQRRTNFSTRSQQSTETPVTEVVSSELNSSNIISMPQDSNILETAIIQDLPGRSEIHSSTAVLKPDKSEVTETTITDKVLIHSELNPSVIISIPEDSNVTESPIIEDLSGSLNLNHSVVNTGDLKAADVSGVVSSPSNVYSSESLPSGLSSEDDSQSSDVSVTKSLTPPLCTSAPSIFDVPEPITELEPLNKEASKMQNSSVESTTLSITTLEKLMISDSQAKEKIAPSELSLSIENLSMGMNDETNVNELPQFNFSVNPSALTATSAAIESTASKPVPIPRTTKSLGTLSTEFSKVDANRSESSSSIETLSTDVKDESNTDDFPPVIFTVSPLASIKNELFCPGICPSVSRSDPTPIQYIEDNLNVPSHYFTVPIPSTSKQDDGKRRRTV